MKAIVLEPISRVHLTVTLVNIVLDVISLTERFGNIIGDYLPSLALPAVPFVPLLPFSYLFWRANFAHDRNGRLIYRPIWRDLTSVFLALAIVAVILVLSPRPVVSSRLPVLIADIDDYTTEQVFSHIGARALLGRVLKQSPTIAVFQEERAVDVLRRMKKSPETRITSDVGREICEREGIGPLVTWSAGESEDTFTLEARILDPKSGSILSEVKAGPFARDRVIESVDELGKKILKTFGDSRLRIFKSTKPLAPATTKSLPALQAYSEALPKLYEFDYKSAEPSLLNALGIDPDFALAKVELASLYEFRGSTKQAIAYLSQAFEHSDSLTEPEKVRVAEFYYWLVKNDHHAAVNELNEFLKRYPRNQERLGTLSTDAFALMKFEVAEEADRNLLGPPPWRRSSAEDAVAAWRTQLALDKFTQALETGRRIQHDMPDLTYNPYLILIANLASGDFVAAEHEVSDLQQANNAEARLWLGGLLDLDRGRLRATQDEWTQYIPFARQEERAEPPWTVNAGNAHLWAARIALLRKDAEQVHRHLEQVKDVDDEYLAEAGKYYARVGDWEKAEERLQILRASLAERSTNQNLMLLKLLESEIEITKGHLQAGFTLMSQAPEYPWARFYWPAQESRAYIALATNHPEEAIKACNEMLGRKGFAFAWDRPDDWIMAHYYLAQAYDKLGKKDIALNFYMEFENLWRNGDPELYPLKDTRNRIAELRR